MRFTPPTPQLLPLLLWAVACAAAVFGLAYLSGQLYWSAAANSPAGEYVLFGRVVPEPLGDILWAVVKPAMFAAIAATAWFGYQLVRTWRAGAQSGLCPACGYDLRATPDRCPECGAIPEVGGTGRR